MFGRWLTSMKVDDYDKVEKKNILGEEFMCGVSAEIRVSRVTLWDEHKVTNQLCILMSTNEEPVGTVVSR